MEAIKEWTGHEYGGCPWRAQSDPFVARVLNAHRASEKGRLHWSEPEPSYRLATGLDFYEDACAAVRIAQAELDRQNAANREKRRG